MHSSFLPLVLKSKPQGSPHMPPGWTNSPTSPSHTKKTSVQVYLLQESDLQIAKSKRAPSRHLAKPYKQKKALHEIANLQDSVQKVFFKCNTLFVPLTLQIKYQG